MRLVRQPSSDRQLPLPLLGARLLLTPADSPHQYVFEHFQPPSASSHISLLSLFVPQSISDTLTHIHSTNATMR